MKDNIYDNLESNIKNISLSRDMYKIVFETEDNKDIEYEIVATFRSKSKKKIYYIMTDNTRSDNDELNITAYYVNEDEAFDEFYPVIDDNELKMVYDVFNKIQNNI